MAKQTIANEALKVGDTIECWWGSHADTITAIRPYTGPLDCIYAIAEFALNKSGMSLEKDGECVVLNRVA